MLAPTGTIGLMMDCDTTGIEPDLALTKAKKLVGGGTMFIVNQTIPRALRNLGYSDDEVDAIVDYIDEHKTIIGAPAFKAEHLPVFACSMGDNTIHYMGHVKMMAAVQPFISRRDQQDREHARRGRRSKTSRTLYLESWRLGLKAVALYRDNCKVGQPLSTQKKAGGRRSRRSARRSSASSRRSSCRSRCARSCRAPAQPQTFSFRVADCHGYVTVGEYEDGRPGELFLKVAKQGSTLAGIMDAFAISVSHGLQYGVPLEAFVEMFTNMRFEPAGMTDDPDIRFAIEPRRLHLPPARGRVPADTTSARRWASCTVGERLQPTLPGVEEATTPSAPSIDLPPEDRAPSATFEMRSSRADAPPGTPAAPRRASARSCSATSAATSCSAPARCHACPSCGSTSGCS